MLPIVNVYPLFLQIICKDSLRQPLSEADAFLFVLQTVKTDILIYCSRRLFSVGWVGIGIMQILVHLRYKSFVVVGRNALMDWMLAVNRLFA